MPRKKKIEDISLEKLIIKALSNEGDSTKESIKRFVLKHEGIKENEVKNDFKSVLRKLEKDGVIRATPKGFDLVLR